MSLPNFSYLDWRAFWCGSSSFMRIIWTVVLLFSGHRAPRMTTVKAMMAQPQLGITAWMPLRITNSSLATRPKKPKSTTCLNISPPSGSFGAWNEARASLCLGPR